MKKWIISIIALCLVGSIGMFYVTKQSVDAEGIVLSNKVFKATFSDPISEQDWENGDVYLQSANGTKIDAKYQLSKDGKSIEILDLENGNYTLFVKKKYGMGKTRYTFNVTNEIPTINTRAELEAYFDKVRKVAGAQKDNPIMTMGEVSATESSPSNGGGLDYSTTNNQVEGIDEGDLVKTDGKHIFTLSENDVAIINVEDSIEMKKVSTIHFDEDFYPNQILLKDNILMVVGQKTYYQTIIVEDQKNKDEKVEEDEVETIQKPMNSMTAVYFYDVSNAKYPTQIREMASEGSMNGVRLNGNMLYLITTAQPDFWMEKEDEKVELRPYIFDSKKGKRPKIIGYGNISILPDSLDGVYTIISGIDIADLEKNPVSIKTFLGGSDQLYMSKENLYVTANIYKFKNPNARKLVWDPAEVETEIYKFALNEKPVEFVGSHRLDGYVLNQFSMDEYNGYFRTVTTKLNNLGGDEPTSDKENESSNSEENNGLSENNLFILDEDMKPVGSITGLAEGERIYSARFMGDTAYMVTFKETDPLFVIDVANPEDPKVLGELKIPGFSNYLHPLDEDHLIGFGFDTIVSSQEGEESMIQTGGMKISLFDVSDSIKPIEADSVIIGGAGTYSPIQHDHHALFQYADKKLYGFPVSIYKQTDGKDYDDFQQEGAVIYEITAENGIVLKGELWNQTRDSQKGLDWNTMIHRLIYVNDNLYTIGGDKINSYRLNDLQKINEISY